MAQDARAFAETVRETVFGIEDGLVSTLGVVVGVAAGSQSNYIVILSGVVVIAVEALSMAAGSFLSSRAARGAEEKQIDDLFKKYLGNKEILKAELVKMYIKDGMDKKIAENIAEDACTNKNFAKKELSLHALGISEKSELSPKKNALFMGLAYIVGGVITVLPFFFLGIGTAIILSIALTVFALFVVGSFKTKFTTGVWWKEGVQMVVVSLGAAGLGYLAGIVVKRLFGVEV